MSSLHYRGEPFRLGEFRSALIGAGAEFLDPTNEWEVLRYRLAGKTGIVYRNAKGRATPSGGAGTHYHNLIAGRPLEMAAGEAKRIKRAVGDHRRTLTLYTDASSYHTTGAASWAAILVCLDGSEHEAHGPLKGEIGSSTAAEARAVANALHHFTREGLITGDVRVILDNQAVVDKLRSGSLKTKSPQFREALEHIQRIARGRFIVLADWVKGHQPKKAAKSDPRVAFNHRCDALAKAHSRSLHEERREAAWARADAIRSEARDAA